MKRKAERALGVLLEEGKLDTRLMLRCITPNAEKVSPEEFGDTWLTQAHAIFREGIGRGFIRETSIPQFVRARFLFPWERTLRRLEKVLGRSWKKLQLKAQRRAGLDDAQFKFARTHGHLGLWARLSHALFELIDLPESALSEALLFKPSLERVRLH